MDHVCATITESSRTGLLEVSLQSVRERCLSQVLFVITTQDVTPEDIKATVRRSSRNGPVSKRLNYSPESTPPPKKRVKS